MAVQPDMSRADRLRAQLRDEIVTAAAEVFAASGYHRAGIADIARRLGVGHSSIYAHFPSKRALLDAVMTDAMGKLAALLVAGNAPDAAETFDEYRDQAIRIASALAALQRTDPTIVRLLRMLVWEAPTIDDELARRATTFVDSSVAMTAAYLRHGRDRGYLRADLDVEATAIVVSDLMAGIALDQLVRGGDAEHQARVIDAALAMYLSGVRA